jgi:hypothetical protein
VRAPDGPRPRASLPAASPVAARVGRGADRSTDRGTGHSIDLVDDLDEEFTDLDDPDGLLAGEAAGSAPAGRLDGHRRGSHLREDEHLDLLGDVDPGLDVPDPPVPSDGNGNGQRPSAGGESGHLRAAGEAVR